MPGKLVEVHLDKVRKIRYDQGAEFRMGCLERPFSLAECAASGMRAMPALVSWIWVSLIPEDRSAFKTPEDLATTLPLHDRSRVGEISKALAATVTGYFDEVAPDKKKAQPKSSKKTASGRG